MDSSKLLLAGPLSAFDDFNSDGTNEYLFVNFQSFFENPISNIKLKIPLYTLSTQTSGGGVFDILIVWQANTFNTWVFPDPTFNGLLPGLTDRSFKEKFGMSAGAWPRFIRIKG